MQLPAGLRALDDRVFSVWRGRRRGSAGPAEPDEPAGARTGSAGQPGGPGLSGGLAAALALLWRLLRLALLACALLLALALAFLVLPTNRHNGVVSWVLSSAHTVAGPLRDVFAVQNPDRQREYNYALAAVVYLVLASVVGRLPTGRRAKG